MAQQDEPDDVAESTLPQPVGWAMDFLRNLFDLQFRRLMTPRIMPSLFLFAILASGVAAVSHILQGFGVSPGQGFIRLLLTGPLLFLVLVVMARVALEFCLATFRIAIHVNKMAGHTEEIAGGLPRIQFWKPLRRKSNQEDDL